MRDVMWIYAAVLLFFSEAWSVDPALSRTNQSISVNSSTTSPKVFVVRHSAYKLGSDVNLPCSNKTWKNMMFVTWTLELKNKRCRIAFNIDGQSDDLCNDGKSIRNTSSAQAYLHIPKFSDDDVGVYKCQSIYSGGIDDYVNHVAIIVPPRTSAWLEIKDNKKVAVCKAERGKPAANISWSHVGNSSYEETLESDGFFTVESRLEVLEGMDTGNLSCAIWHPFWGEERLVRPILKKGGYVPWLYVLIVAVIVFLVGFLFFAQKKLIKLRPCQRSETSLSKSPPIEDVEEVEPYASYVQRVNSIYCSSADLFT